MKILIQPYARELRNGEVNPKNYPHWPELISMLETQGHHIIHVGVTGEQPLTDDFVCQSLPTVEKFIKSCDLWISVDSFLQHMAWYLGVPGIVLFGPSDPKIFGHEENTNLYVNSKYFRPDPCGIWESMKLNNKAFCSPETVYNLIAGRK